MKKATKCLALVLCAALVFGVLPVSAAPTQKTATLTYRAISVNLDGTEINPADANGKAVDPFIIDGTTYLPLRALSDALGFSVDWDDASSTIAITSGNAQALTPGVPATKTGTETATLNYRDIRLVVDGKAVTPTDANGKVVEPFIIDGTTYLPVRAIAELLGCTVNWNDARSEVTVSTDNAMYIFRNDGVTEITDASMDRFFREGNATDGVNALLNAGKVIINNVPAPKSASETDDYKINFFTSLWKTGESTWAYSVHKLYSATDLSFEEARLGFLQGISKMRGLLLKLYSEDGQYADRIEVLIKESTLVNSMTVEGENTRIGRYDFALATDEIKPDINDIVFPTKNVDPNLKIGDIALYWYDGAEWHIQQARGESGTLRQAESDPKFDLNGTRRDDALITRYNLQAANRTSQFLNAHMAFDLVSVPVTQWSTETGYPIGFTRGSNARTALGIASLNAQAIGRSYKISADGSDVLSTDLWVTQETIDAYNAAIAEAQAVLDDSTSTSIDMDMAIYNLYAALGSSGNRPSGLRGAGKPGTIAVLYVFHDDGETEITDASMDKYFKEGNAKDGVVALMNAGKVYVNNIPAPKSESETSEYMVNNYHNLWKNENGTWDYSVHAKYKGQNMSFEEARLGFINGISMMRGLDMYLYSTDGQYADRIEVSIYESALVDSITVNGDVTKLARYDFELNTASEPRPDMNDVDFPTKNVDPNLKVGDIVLFWFDGKEWYAEQAVAATGILVRGDSTGEDVFVLNGTARPDALITRFNLQASNRTTQFLSDHTAFGLERVPVTQWSTFTGYPIGYTRGVNARTALEIAIPNARAIAGDYQVSADGSDVLTSEVWVTEDLMDAYLASIDAAQALLDDPDSSGIAIDWAIYQMYAALGEAGRRPSGLVGNARPGTRAVLASVQDDGTTPVTAAAYDQYFRGTAAAGVEEILNAGKFIVNGFPLPASESEFNINLGFITLLKTADGSWTSSVHKGNTSDPTFTEARTKLAEGLTKFAGLNVNLFDDDGDGYADRIETTVKQSVRVDKITETAGGVQISRGNFTPAKKEGAKEVNDVVFPSANVDPALKAGDVGLYWEAPDGFHIDRCPSAVGRLTEGADHGYYVFESVRYEDVGGVTKYHLIAGNRPGQFLEAERTLGLLGTQDIICWKIGDYGIAAFSNIDPVAVLTRGVAAAKDAKAAASGADAEALAALDTRIAEAETALAGAASGTDLDMSFYQLARAVDAVVKG